MNSVRHKTRGYSLIELVFVVAVVSLLVGLVGGTTFPLIRSHRLSSSAGKLQADLAYASQLSSKLNAPIEFRFYSTSDKNSGRHKKGYRAYQILRRNSKDGSLIPLTKVNYFETGVQMHQKDEYTSLFLLGISSPRGLDPEIPVGNAMTRDYDFVGFQFLPNGSTSLSKDGQQWSITLVNEGYEAKQSLPDNFRTLVINPVTGNVRRY